MSEYFIPYCIRILILLTAVIATVNYPQFKISKEKYFLHFLWFTVAIEFIATILNHLVTNAYIIYNFFAIVGFLFYLNWFYIKLNSVLVKYLFYTFLIVSIANLSFKNPIKDHLEFSFVFGAVSILICSFMYYSKVLRNDELFKITQRLSFWIVTGILFFYIGMIPLILLANILDFSGVYYLSVLLGLNIILYGCYIIGFLWSKKTFNR